MTFARFTTKTKIKKSPEPVSGQKKINVFPLSVLCLGFFVIMTPLMANARTFDPNNIISDDEMFNANSLSRTAIQHFLERENSMLARYTQILNGTTKTAAEMIWDVSHNHSINPRFILTTLEKEQGLLSRSTATKKALDWATGYGCYGGTCRDKYQGFYNQIDATAETQEIYKQKAGQFSFRVGKTTTTFDNYPVTPQNQATANLYIYTPHVGNAPELGVSNAFGANKLFWRIWHRYFSSQKFLDGQVITYNGNYYLVQKNTKRRFATKDIFLADYKESDAINVASRDALAYPDGPMVEFSNNTLVKSSASGQVYLLADNIKRPILDDSALALLSDVRIATVTTDDVPTVDESKLDLYQLGGLISSASKFPQGVLLRDPIGALWFVQDGLKHAVDQTVWQNRFDSQSPGAISAESVTNYPTGEPMKLKDGTFVAASGNYYLISSGERMRIQDVGVFDRVFGASKRNSALQISTALLEVHGAGEMIDYIDDTIIDQSAGSTPGATTAPAGSYAATFGGLRPESLILTTGQKQATTVSFTNTGATTWTSSSVWLESTDTGATTSSFGAPSRVELNESSVSTGELGTFTLTLTAPTNQSGLLGQQFTLYHGTDSAKTSIASIGKFVIVKNGVSAQVVSQNIPLAVKNTWKPITIVVKIKNTSTDTTWLSRRTALELYSLDGSTSPFYDQNDWVRKEVVGVPLNKTSIAPGETGEFTFTLDPRGITKGHHILNFQLKLLDKNKEVFLDGAKAWHQEIRVD